MSSVAAVNAAGDPPVAPVDVESVGPSLRRLRKAKGWSIGDVSARVKFSVRQIDALENERWDELPEGLSLRGLIRGYARMLDADAEALIAALEPQVGAAHVNYASLVADTPPRALYPESETSGSLVWLIAILIVLGAAVVYAFSQGWLPQAWLPVGWSADSAS